MIDITGPKVLIPALLFAALSPGLLLAVPQGAGLLVQAVVHALVLAVVYWAIAKFVLKITLSQADLVVPALLFVLLTPGVVLTLPPRGALFFSGKSSPVAVGAHTLVFALVFAYMRSQFPAYY
jgi:uncharacterized membrane protein YwzB